MKIVIIFSRANYKVMSIIACSRYLYPTKCCEFKFSSHMVLLYLKEKKEKVNYEVIKVCKSFFQFDRDNQLSNGRQTEEKLNYKIHQPKRVDCKIHSSSKNKSQVSHSDSMTFKRNLFKLSLIYQKENPAKVGGEWNWIQILQQKDLSLP